LLPIDRRTFLLTSLGLGAGCAGGARLDETPAPLDAHVHLFGIGDAGSGCFLAPAMRRHFAYGALRRLLDLPERRMDEAYVASLLSQLHRSPLGAVLLFAQDGRYDAGGRLDRDATSAFVPNDWVFAVCAREPRRLLPCASINPKRRDALAELERCHALGARAVKVHPPVQDVDPADASFIPFWRKLAELGLVLIVHTGSENAAPITRTDVCDPLRLEPALREGCTVIAAHGGFGSAIDGVDFFPSLQMMVRRHHRLFCDTAVLGSIFRWRALPRLLADEVVTSRTLHASDWPFPSALVMFWQHLPRESRGAIARETNLLTRDLRLKQALGLPPASFVRGYDLLAR